MSVELINKHKSLLETLWLFSYIIGAMPDDIFA